MAGILKIVNGTKMQLAFDVPSGQEPNFDMICTFAKALDESAFLISIPMRDGKLLEMDETQKLLIRYGSGEEVMILAGYADAVVKEGIRKYWKMRRVSEQRQFFERKDERLKAALRVQYTQDTWKPNADGIIVPETGMTMDISAGGAAMFSNRRFEVNEVIFFSLPKLGVDEEGQGISDIVAVVCWNREAPKGSLYRLICGLQFRVGDGEEREKLQRYIAYVKRKYKL